jgi:hypothetical protein
VRHSLKSFAELYKYDATTHFVGQSTIFTLTGDRATGEAYCPAPHVTVDVGKRRMMLASLRYLDTFVKIDGSWLFAERCLYVDWLEERKILSFIKNCMPGFGSKSRFQRSPRHSTVTDNIV